MRTLVEILKDGLELFAGGPGSGRHPGDGSVTSHEVTVKYGPRLQYERKASVKIGSQVRVQTSDGEVGGKVTAFDKKNGSDVASYTTDKGEQKWAYLSQIRMVY